MLKYISPQTFIDQSFFSQLADLKLNHLKLDTSPHPIHAFVEPPSRLTRRHTAPILNLDHESYKTSHGIDGYLHNVNTIEAFENADRAKMLQEWAKSILAAADSGELDRLNQFHVLSYADLKRYRFHYWVAHPVVYSQWRVQEERVYEKEHKVDNLRGRFFRLENKEIKEIKDEEIRDKESVVEKSVEEKSLEDTHEGETESCYLFLDTSCGAFPSSHLRNYLFYLARRGISSIRLVVYRVNGVSVEYDLEHVSSDPSRVSGWERSHGRLAPKVADLGQLMDPEQLASQAVDLNLRLMKWRIMPELNLEAFRSQRALLLGAGTLGSYVARGLMAWGVRTITFVDNGRVSYSNPVRQPLYRFNDCFSDGGQGEWKAECAARALKEVFPGVVAKGYRLSVPMVGHTGEEDRRDYERLCGLFEEHDVVFLLMDSRESRWLPTVMGRGGGRLVVNVALGYDGYLVMRHGVSDSAPSDSEGQNQRGGIFPSSDSEKENQRGGISPRDSEKNQRGDIPAPCSREEHKVEPNDVSASNAAPSDSVPRDNTKQNKPDDVSALNDEKQLDQPDVSAPSERQKPDDFTSSKKLHERDISSSDSAHLKQDSSDSAHLKQDSSDTASSDSTSRRSKENSSKQDISPSDSASRYRSKQSRLPLGCYFCNDIVAPQNSQTDRTLDQMCTVTRPGCAPAASALAVELYSSIIQHPLGKNAPSDSHSPFGSVPHQIRGFLSSFSQSCMSVPAYGNCSACSERVVEGYRSGGWEFVKACLDDPGYLEGVSGLEEVQRRAEEVVGEMESDEDWVL